MWKVKKKVSYWYDFQVFAQLVIHCLPFNSLNCANSTIIHSHELSTCRRMLSTSDQFSPWWIWTRISEQKENQLGYRWRQAVWHVVRVNARIIEMLQVVWANSSKKLDYSDQQRLKGRNDILIIFHNVNFSVLCMSRVRVPSSTAAFRANSHSKNKFASIDESAVVVFGEFFSHFFLLREHCVSLTRTVRVNERYQVVGIGGFVGGGLKVNGYRMKIIHTKRWKWVKARRKASKKSYNGRSEIIFD